MKAVVLAAGQGSRLKPLTNNRPKPMVPVANRPLLEYVVEAVADAGITDLVLVVGYKRDRIQTYFGDGDDFGVDIEYAVQEKQLGTGHAVLQAEPYVSGPFVVVNGDRIITPTVVERVVEAVTRGERAMAVTRSDQPSGYGEVTLDGDAVSRVTEKPGPDRSSSEIINAGVYGFDRSIFDAIRETETGADGELGITSTIQRLVERTTVRPVRYRGLWIDVSHVWDVVTVNAGLNSHRETTVAESATVKSGAQVGPDVNVGPNAVVESNATLKPGTTIGAGATVGSNVVVSNTVAFPGAVVGDGSVVVDSVVGENASLGANTTAAGGTGDAVADGRVYEDVTLGAVVGDNTDVGGGVTFATGSVVGDDAEIETGATVSGPVRSGSEVRRG